MTTEAGIKRGTISVKFGSPMEISEDTNAEDSLSTEQHELHKRVATTLKAYLTAAKDLLNGRLKDLREIAPPHMTSACRPTAFVFPDGILVRYDVQENPDLKVLVGTPTKLTKRTEAGDQDLNISLQDLAPLLSDSFLHCVTDPTTYDPGEQTLKLTFSAVSQDGTSQRDLITQKIIAIAPLPTPADETREAPFRLIPAITIRNEFDVMLHVEVPDPKSERRPQFLVRNRIRLPVGWQAIDVFPPFSLEIWNPETAVAWAEKDLLSALLAHNVRDNQFRAIDPHAEARKKMAKLGCGLIKPEP